jgi:hypothetical protein
MTVTTLSSTGTMFIDRVKKKRGEKKYFISMIHDSMTILSYGQKFFAHFKWWFSGTYWIACAP